MESSPAFGVAETALSTARHHHRLSERTFQNVAKLRLTMRLDRSSKGAQPTRRGWRRVRRVVLLECAQHADEVDRWQ